MIDYDTCTSTFTDLNVQILHHWPILIPYNSKTITTAIFS